MSRDADAGTCELAGHALWTRDERWGRECFAPFLSRLYRGGLFLPALLAYDLRSVVERGERRPGKCTHLSRAVDTWAAFMHWAYVETVGRLTASSASRSTAREESAFRLASLVAMGLMAQVDVSPLRDRNDFDPEAMVVRELQRLRGDLGPADPLVAIWSLLEIDVRSERFHRLVPLSELLAPGGQADSSIDPFLAKLLDNDERTLSDEPRIRGSHPFAGNPRRDLFDTGEIPERDLGPLPSELGRLAPSELLLYRQATHGPRGGKLGTARVRYRTLFLVRATQSGLLQRFQYDVRPAEMKPSIQLQIDFFDSFEHHQLSDLSSRPPVISWHRALIVELVHQVARLSDQFFWSTSYSVNYCNGETTKKTTLEGDSSEEPSLSPLQALEHLVAACPYAFTAARSRPPTSLDERVVAHRRVDLVIQVAIGISSSADSDRFLTRDLDAAARRFAAVERHPDDTWLVRLAEGHDLALGDLDPATAATVVLRRLLLPEEGEEEAMEIGS